MAGEPPAAVLRLGQQYPGPAGEPGLARGIGGDRGQSVNVPAVA
ncbi:hypothetical protein [Trebonia kvetii]|nr:hypothetical protein [Trebonia kvetii]